MMFVSKRTLKKNNEVLWKRAREQEEVNIILQRAIKERDGRISDLLEKNRAIEGELVTVSEILDTKQKEVKRLKTLCTKNGIEYRKEN